MNKFFKGFINYTETFFDDTAKKVVNICKTLSKILCWASVICGWLSLPFMIIMAIIQGSVSLAILGLITPLFGYINAFIISISFALTVMAVTAMSDIHEIKKSGATYSPRFHGKNETISEEKKNAPKKDTDKTDEISNEKEDVKE